MSTKLKRLTKDQKRIKELEGEFQNAVRLLNEIRDWRDHIISIADGAGMVSGDEAHKFLAQLAHERKEWERTAAEMLSSVEYYQGIVDNIGNMFGVEARTADDGTVGDSVLRAKVAGLVADLIVNNSCLSNAFDNLQDFHRELLLKAVSRA